MRVLIFGANGQVGREAVQLAPALDMTPLPVTRADVDLIDAQAIAAFMKASKCQAVLNAAAYTAVDKAETEPVLVRQINAEAPKAIGHTCAELGIPLVHYSTDYVFDGTGADPYIETDPKAPLGVYGATKLAGERAILSTDAAAAIIRLSWIFSAHGQNFVKTMLRLARERDMVRVVADQTGKPTPAKDAAFAGLTALQALAETPRLSGIYHYAGDTQTTWADFARAIFEAADLPTRVDAITTADYPTPAKRPAWSVLDTTKFETAFGLQPADWRSALHGVIEELQAEQDREGAP
jgi:dTDP-4-dehydrorhamnose reductase